MNTVLVLGANGMLGQALKKAFVKAGYVVYGIDRRETDFCFDLLNDDRLIKCIETTSPNIIINAAAIVSLEKCEGNPGEAYCINSRLPSILTEICKLKNIYLVHISTDHYYTNDGRTKHNEDDRIILLNEYARTKYIGEQFVLTYDRALVVRTNIVGFRGTGQQTFVEWVVDEINDGREMVLFDDFYTSSMHVADLSRVLGDLITRKVYGLYNVASSDVTSKKEFILALSNELFGHPPRYRVSSVKEHGGVVRANSLGLNTEKIEAILGYKMPGLRETISKIKEDYIERAKDGV